MSEIGDITKKRMEQLANLASSAHHVEVPLEICEAFASATAMAAINIPDFTKAMSAVALLTHAFKLVYQAGYLEGRRSIESLVGKG